MSVCKLLMQRLLWVFYISVALLFVQGARLHMHSYGHDLTTSNHTHHEQLETHFDHSVLESGHADEVAEIDLSQQGFLKKHSLTALLVTLIIAVVAVLLRNLIIPVPWRYDRRIPSGSLPSSLRPPLRAPPV